MVLIQMLAIRSQLFAVILTDAEGNKRKENLDIQTRCFSKIIYDFYNTLCKDSHRLILNKTCFAGLFAKQLCDANMPLVTQLIMAWNNDEKFFKLGQVELHLTSGHVGAILGLPDEGAQVELKEGEDYAPWIRRRIPKGKVDRPAIIRALHQLAPSCQANDIEDFARLFLMLLFTTLLFQRSNYSCPPTYQAW